MYGGRVKGGIVGELYHIKAFSMQILSIHRRVMFIVQY